MGQPIRQLADIPIYREANPGNWNISLPGGKENNSDSLSSGDRTGISLNQRCFGIFGVVGLRHTDFKEVEMFWKDISKKVKILYT
jgi:hypothetical protein